MVTVYSTATSLDGFIADPAHSLDWLFVQTHQEPTSPTLRLDGLLARAGALVLGATTYLWVRERVVAAGESWPYAAPTWVLTHRDLPRLEGADLRFTSGDVAEVHPRVVASAAGGDVWVVGGGDLAGQLADAGVLDEVVVAIAPVTLGAGAPLLPRRLQLRLLETQSAADFAYLRYAVTGPRPAADFSAPDAPGA